jgi:hypothetical protein
MVPRSPCIVIGPFPINEMKLLSFVISLLMSRAQRIWSLIRMGYDDDGLCGQDCHARAASGLVRENPRFTVVPCLGHVP